MVRCSSTEEQDAPWFKIGTMDIPVTPLRTKTPPKFQPRNTISATQCLYIPMTQTELLPWVKLYRAENPVASSSPSATNFIQRYRPLDLT